MTEQGDDDSGGEEIQLNATVCVCVCVCVLRCVLSWKLFVVQQDLNGPSSPLPPLLPPPPTPFCRLVKDFEVKQQQKLEILFCVFASQRV